MGGFPTQRRIPSGNGRESHAKANSIRVICAATDNVNGGLTQAIPNVGFWVRSDAPLGALGEHRLSFCCAVYEVFLHRWRTAAMEKVADLGCTQWNIDEAGHTFEAGQSRRTLPEAISVHACCSTKAGQECGHSSS